jgi:hypothetical protein
MSVPTSAEFGRAIVPPASIQITVGTLLTA